jgi:hypothetical protein
MWARLVRFARSVPETVLITELPDGSPIITAATGGTLVPHGVRGRVPRSARAWPVGTTASTAVITTGAIDGRTVRLYATDTVQIHVEVIL